MSKQKHITLGSVPPAADAYVIAQDAHHRRTPTLVIVADERTAHHLAQEVKTFAPTLKTCQFPAWNVQPYDRINPSSAITAERLTTFRMLQKADTNHKPLVVFTTPAALITKLKEPEDISSTLTIGEDYPRQALQKLFIDQGYSKTDVVTDIGEFTTRGAIVDIFPPTEKTPLRLEFFDTELETIRPFNPLTQRTITYDKSKSPQQVNITPVAPVFLSEDTISTFRKHWREHFTTTQHPLYLQVSEGILPNGIMHYLPLFETEKDSLTTLFDAAPNARLIFTANISDATTAFHTRLKEAYYFRQEALKEEKKHTDNSYYALPPELLYLTETEWQTKLNQHSALTLSPFKQEGTPHKPNAPLEEHLLPSSSQKAIQSAIPLLQESTKKGFRLILTAPTQSALLRLNKTLEDHAPQTGQNTLPVAFEVKTWADTEKHKASLLLSNVTHGFTDTEYKFTLLTDQDIYGEKIGSLSHKTKRKSKSDAQKFAHFSELSIGDYVVHEDHGIGRFDALITMDTPQNNGKSLRQDFLKLTYADNARLFVPVEALDVLSRFKSGETHQKGEVQLDKLGGTAWQTRKERIKEDLMAMASQLMETAAAREIKTTNPHPSPDMLYEEFCASFPHRLTEDQARTMDEVEDDMTSVKPMDRLVVGDVGFGKTEVAVRAAFIAAAGGRQVAVVVPTTLLARQHADVFKERFKNFPFTVASLSRLVPPKVASKTKTDLASGKVDIIIGTHALLSDNIKFKDLGLLIIDEEQRFGVKHKETLKSLKDTVDVLTLTATPIPRTLHMGLSGLKTLSTITTPPVDRLATHTLISPWDAKTVREQIMRELYRGGQVYIVTPQVKDIPKLEERIRAIVPEGKIQTAHGQMPASELENVMEAFYAGDFNILIATTIVESGLDVKNANTLLVHRADRFGLAQLYQIRGRVGRGNAQGYATFFLPEGPITADGLKRLQVLQKLEGLGAGFMLANYDMDIRGFGNLVGKQQSGQIREIGAELYGKLLKEAVDTLKRQQNAKHAAKTGAENATTATQTTIEHHFTPTLNLGLTYLLPEQFVPSQTDRLSLYRQLANLENEEEIQDFRTDLEDRFGPLPQEAEHLLTVVKIRNICKSLNIEKLDAGPKGLTLTFYQKTFANPMNLLKFIQSNVGVISLNPDQSITVNTPLHNAEQRLNQTQKILQKFTDLLH